MDLKRLRLTSSIYVTILFLFAFQCLVYAGFWLGYRLALPYTLAFAVLSVSFHLLVFFLLLRFREEFYIEETGVRLEAINLANLVTLCRLTSLPTTLILVLAAKDYPIKAPLVALVAFVFATDFIDGWISRTAKQVTKFGKMADSASDYSLIVVLSVVYQYYFLIPPLFFALIVFRLALQTVFAFILLGRRSRIVAKSTLFGKAAVASTMMLYAMETFFLVAPAGFSSVRAWGEGVVGAIVFASIFDKIIAFRNNLKEARAKESAMHESPEIKE